MARRSRDGQNGKLLGFHRLQPNLHLKRENRVERPAGGSGQSGLQCHWIAHGPTPSDKPVPVRLVPGQRDVRIFGNQGMQKDRCFGFRASRATFEQQRVVISEIAAADEQFAEGRMPLVILRRLKHDLAIGRDLDFRRRIPFVDQGYPAYFDIVERCDDQFLPRRDIAVAAKGFGHMLMEYDLAVLAFLMRRQIAYRPEPRRVCFLNIKPDAMAIPRRVRTPSGQHIAVPRQPASTCGRGYGRHVAISQQMHLRRDGFLRRNPRRRHPDRRDLFMRLPTLVDAALFNRNLPRNAFLQQQADRSHVLFRHDAPDMDVGGYGVHDRREDHSLMVRHVGLHRHERVLAGQTRRSIVERIPEAVTTDRTQFRQFSKVLDRGAGFGAERKRGRIGRDDQILGQAAPDTQTGNAERAVLIVVAGIHDTEG